VNRSFHLSDVYEVLVVLKTLNTLVFTNLIALNGQKCIEIWKALKQHCTMTLTMGTKASLMATVIEARQARLILGRVTTREDRVL